MAPLSAAAALAALQAAGTDARRAPAPVGTCRTCCYRVAGQPVNLGRLRQLGADALAAKAAADATPSPDERAAAVVAHLVRKFPASTPETYRAAVARLQDRGAAVTPAAVLGELERPAPLAAVPVSPAAADAALAAPYAPGPVLPGTRAETPRNPTPNMTTTTFQKPWFPEVSTSAQVQVMSKAQLGEILHRTGSPRRQECSKVDLVGMVCFRLGIYGDSRA